MVVDTTIITTPEASTVATPAGIIIRAASTAGAAATIIEVDGDARRRMTLKFRPRLPKKSPP